MNLTRFFKLLSPSPGSSTSSADFIESTLAHRERLIVTAQWAQNRFSEDFSKLSHELIYDYFKVVHDTYKLADIGALRRLGFRGRECFADFFARYDGVDKRELKFEERKYFDHMIDELNRLERQLQRRFFSQYKLCQKQTEQIQFIEPIVDVLDTKIFRAQEMGIRVVPFAAQDWFIKQGDMRSAAMARSLEQSIRLIHDQNTLNLPSCKSLLKAHAKIAENSM